MNPDNSQIKIVETVDGAEQTLSAAAAAAAPKPTPTIQAQQIRQKPDPYIWGIYIAFLVISLVELFSASSTLVTSSNVYSPLIGHSIFLILGLFLVLWLQNVPYVWFRKISLVFAVLSLLLLLVSSYMGVEINGAQRALRIAGFTVQPAEIVKLSIVMLLSSILSRNQTRGGVTNKGVVESAIVVIVFAGILWKNGLTNTILLMVVSICMFLIGGIEWKKLLTVGAVYGLCAGVLWSVKYTNESTSSDDANFDNVRTEQTASVDITDGRQDTHKGRMSRYIEGVHPGDKIDDFNRQVILSSFAQANGGLFGQGPGNSRESVRLPLAFSDYIYSIIVEDTGFVGGACLLLLYLLLIARAGRIAYKCSRAFPAFLIMGCAVMIVFQALVHMAIVTGVAPVSGQPLPFISKGGTSIIVMSAAIGMMLSVSRYAVTSGKKKEIKAELKELPEDMQAANFSEYSIEDNR